MEDLQKRQKEQHLANRTANQALHAAQRQVSDCQANLADLATDKAQLQQSAEDLQATMAASSQVGAAHL